MLTVCRCILTNTRLYIIGSIVLIIFIMCGQRGDIVKLKLEWGWESVAPPGGIRVENAKITNVEGVGGLTQYEDPVPLKMTGEDKSWRWYQPELYVNHYQAIVFTIEDFGGGRIIVTGQDQEFNFLIEDVINQTQFIKLPLTEANINAILASKSKQDADRVRQNFTELTGRLGLYNDETEGRVEISPTVAVAGERETFFITYSVGASGLKE